MDLQAQAEAAKQAARILNTLTTDQKNQALLQIGEALLARQDEILEANKEDVSRAEEAGQTVMVDRLLLDAERIEGIVNELKNVVSLEDEVGKVMDRRERPNGLSMERVRIPLGVIGIIYESRPNVTVDAAVLCLKSGNAVMLKGGSDAISSNRALVKVMREALEGTAIPSDAIQFLDTTDRSVTGDFLKLRGYLDVIIPRGGKGLINFVVENSQIPVIETGASVVHTYIDKDADLDKSAEIVVNAKTRRVSICNTLDTLLIHADVLEEFLGKAEPLLSEKNVELRCDEQALAVVGSKGVAAQPDDFGKEFLDYILAIKVVNSVNEAIDHISKYSLKHSEAICTENKETAERFLQEIDAAAVYVNASTQFSDGAQFGLGAEIGISTQKLHVRGPFALEGLTTFKWLVRGDGQTRPA
ncbi:glutamate-5-semialdehyde dehydrogenase [Candidatus Peregrinibacteria bacterium]|jgi:glutamate-5-semialdehyde dehydrogenase|nr:glutamate-5-semialdehyde dehydrogenase [Candidatus Peregrinibacteria bacterium]MBT7483877.1 glutamate-5-semialdehyde dehydrogenase [Candidatus Peregrinibacteria bacterium]